MFRMCFAVVSLFLYGALAWGGPKAVTYRGVVSLPDGKPASGAHVVLSAFEMKDSNPQPLPLRETVADAQGRFLLSAPPSATQYRTLFAWRDGYALGRAAQKTAPDIVSRGASGGDYKLQLAPRGNVALVVRDEEAKPIAGASFVPRFVYSFNADGSNYSMAAIPPTVAAQWKIQTDAEGRATLWAVPDKAMFMARVAAPGWATEQLSQFQGRMGSATSQIEVTLTRPAIIQGQVVAPPGKKLPANLRVTRHAYDRENHFFPALKVQTDGTFLITDAPAGTYRFRVQSDSNQAMLIEGEGTVEARAGQTATVKIALKTIAAAIVELRAFKNDGKSPIPGVKFQLYNWMSEGAMKQATTDKTGKATLYVQPGQWHLSVQSSVPNWIADNRHKPLMLTAAKRSTATVLFYPARSLAVRVVNEKGRPVAGATVTASPSTYVSRQARSDAKGIATLSQLREGQTFTLRAQTETLFGTPQSYKVAAKNPLFTLRVKSGYAARITGKVADQFGKPVAGAQVTIQQRNGNRTSNKSPIHTNASGAFLSPLLDPQASYTLFVRASDSAILRLPAWKPQPGQTRDLGTLKVRRRTAVVAGVVRDSAGQPVSGARVFTDGGQASDDYYSSSQREARSDAQGRFRIGALEDGPRLVFVEHKDYAFSGAHLSAPRGDVTLTLRRTAESVASQKVTLPDEAARRALALRWLDKALTQKPSTDNYEAQQSFPQLLATLARRDAPRALRLAAGNANLTSAVRGELGELALAQTPPNVTAALAYWNSDANAYSAVARFHRAALRYRKTQPELAARLAGYALAKARTVSDVKQRLMLLAQSGALLNKVGQNGVPTLKEVAATAARLPENDYIRSYVALSLASADADGALRLLGAKQQSPYLPQVALALAESNPDKAIELARRTPPYQRDDVLARLCGRLAASDLAKAQQLAATLTNTAARSHAALAIAKAQAPKDKDAAMKTLRDAMKTSQSASSDFYGYGGTNSPSATLARMAALARRLGMPEAPEWTWRAISQHRSGYFFGEANFVRNLAAADPAIARLYLQSMMPRLSVVTKNNSQDYVLNEQTRALLQLAMQVDLNAAETLLKKAAPARLPIVLAPAARWALADEEERLQIALEDATRFEETEPSEEEL